MPRGGSPRAGFAAGAAVAVVVFVIGVALLDRAPEESVEPGTEEVELPSPDDLQDTEAAAAPPVECDPPGCLDWWTSDLDQRPIQLVGDLLVQDGRDHLVVVDVQTGETRWRQEHASPRPVSVPTGYERYAARAGDDLAIAIGTSVWFHDLTTGELRAEVDLGGLSVHGLESLGDGVLVRGRGGVAQVTAAEGVRWRDERRLIGSSTALVVTDGTDIAALDAWEGTTRWEQPGIGPHVVVLGTQIIHVEDDGLVFRDAITGSALHRESLDGQIEYLRSVGGGLLAAVTADRVHLLHPDSRRVLDVRDRATPDQPLYGPVGARTPQGFVAVWSGDGPADSQIVAYPSGAGEPVVVPLDVEAPTEGRLQRIAVHDLGGGEVRVRFPGAQVRDVDLGAGEVVRRLDRTTGWGTDEGGVAPLYPGSGDLQMHGGLVLEPLPGSSRLIGTEGQVVVRGVMGLVAGVPPIVHGPDGAGRLTADGLWGSPVGPALTTQEGRSAPARP